MFAAVLCLVSMVAFIYATWQRLRTQPPGPWGLPVVGHLLQMDQKAPHEPLARWAAQYGSIFQVRMGELPIVAVSCPSLLGDLLARNEVTGRPDTPSRRLLLAGGRREGISQADNELWGETRRLLTVQLEGLGGEGHSKLERSIQRMADEFCGTFLANNVGRRVQLGDELAAAVANILWGMLTGERRDVEDTEVQEAVAAAGHMLQRWHAALLADAFPWAEQLALMLLPPDLPRELDQLAERLLEPTLTKLRGAASEDPDKAAASFASAYLQAQTARPLLLSEQHLSHTVLDVLLTGGEPTAATLEWLVCFLCARQDVQERAQQEVDLAIGHKRLPTYADRARMPFLEAVLMETHRRADVLPLGEPHTAARDLSIAGYRIPRGAQITPLLRAVHLDPQRFPEPLAFRPERFLDATGKLLPNEALLPFLVGRRQCPGQALASATLFIFLAAILQRFTLRFPPGFQHDFGVLCDGARVLRPRPFKFVPELREE
ncbi:Cytochrome P450 2J5 [Amphibalanus amphitrite]|uniref:Cytochrome P450 2J5 n=1 Tax=Amphibalanus amphitrite TaxID=1232801 RepID=A0A6A4WFC8_AMPAM|nr:Cytochrome P450 2J5 [Amphibalanus amphitrite]